jgi:hypothetical protein
MYTPDFQNRQAESRNSEIDRDTMGLARRRTGMTTQQKGAAG